MSEPRRVILASPYGSLLYERGRERRFIDNGAQGLAIVYEPARMCVVRWDHNGDETEVPAHWLAPAPCRIATTGEAKR